MIHRQGQPCYCDARDDRNFLDVERENREGRERGCVCGSLQFIAAMRLSLYILEMLD